MTLSKDEKLLLRAYHDIEKRCDVMDERIIKLESNIQDILRSLLALNNKIEWTKYANKLQELGIKQ